MKDVNIVFFFQKLRVFDAWPLLVEVDFKAPHVELECTPSLFGDIFYQLFVEVHAVFVVIVSRIAFKGDMLWQVLVVHPLITEARANIKDFLKASAD